MFDFLVFIGRFQPFHLAHQAVIQQAFKRSKSVIVLLGSAQPEEGFSETSFRPACFVSNTAPGSDSTRTLKNLFTASEREQMIRAAFSAEQQSQLHFAGLVDVFNDEKWTGLVKLAVQDIVQHSAQAVNSNPASTVGLIGHFKDQSSYYLSLFPEWPLVELENYFELSATPIREQYLLGHLPTLAQVPLSTLDYLMQFQQTPAYQALQQQARQALKEQEF